MASGIVRWLPDDGRKWQQFDASTKYVSYIGSAQLNGNVTSVGTGKAVPAGFTPMVIPRVTYYTQTAGQGGKWNIWWAGDLSLDSGGNVHWSNHSKTIYGNGHETIDRPVAVVDAFAIAPAQRGSGRPGVWASDGADFSAIDDTSMIGYVIYRDSFHISGTWGVPQDVINKVGDRYVVFARWTNSARVGLNRKYNRIEVYNANGTGIGGDVDIQVVIVACGAIPEYPNAGSNGRAVGMIIRNSQGQVTFSTKYPALQWRGASYNFSYYESFDSNRNEQLRWVGPSGNVSQPMIPLCSIGKQTNTDDDQSGIPAGFTGMHGVYAAFMMRGDNAVSCCRGSRDNLLPDNYNWAGPGNGIMTMSPTVFNTAVNLPCIDATDYF